MGKTTGAVMVVFGLCLVGGCATPPRQHYAQAQRHPDPRLHDGQTLERSEHAPNHYDSATVARTNRPRSLGAWLRSGRGITWGQRNGPVRDSGLDGIMVDTLTSSQPGFSSAPEPHTRPVNQENWVFPEQESRR